MYLLDKKTIEQFKHTPSQKGFAVRMELDYDAFNEMLTKLNVQAKDIVEHADVRHEVAYMIIDMANKEDLVPFKDNYKVHDDINKKYFMGNKLGDAGEIKRGRIYMKRTANISPAYADLLARKRYADSGLTPPRYYHVVDEENEQYRRVHGLAELKGKSLKEYQSMSPKKLIGLDKRKSHIDDEGRKLYKAKLNPTLKMKYQTYDIRRWWNKRTNKMKTNLQTTMPINYIQQGHGEGIATGMKKGTKYADRPPHLRDSYRVVSNASKGTTNIIYSVRKKPDRYYIDSPNGTDNYAYNQYFGEDVDWRRTTPDTTSRWLEVAIGIPVEEKIKIPSIPTGDLNFKQIEKFVKKKLTKGVK